MCDPERQPSPCRSGSINCGVAPAEAYLAAAAVGKAAADTLAGDSNLEGGNLVGHNPVEDNPAVGIPVEDSLVEDSLAEGSLLDHTLSLPARLEQGSSEQGTEQGSLRAAAVHILLGSLAFAELYLLGLCRDIRPL